MKRMTLRLSDLTAQAIKDLAGIDAVTYGAIVDQAMDYYVNLRNETDSEEHITALEDR